VVIDVDVTALVLNAVVVVGIFLRMSSLAFHPSCKKTVTITNNVGGAVDPWLERSSLDQAVQFRALAEDIVLCSWAKYFTHTVPLSTHVYKWVPPNLMLGGNPAMD